MSRVRRHRTRPVEIFRSHSSDRGRSGARAARRARDRGGGRVGAVAVAVSDAASGRREFRISVSPAATRGRARELIAAHLDEAAAAEVRRLSETLGPLEERIDYHFRDLGLLEHALTHRSRAHEDASGGVIDNESLEFLGDAVLGFVDRRHAVHAVPDAQRRLQVEGEGRHRLGRRRWRGWRRTSISAATCCSGAAKRRPAAGRSTRFSPTASRRSSRRSISTAASTPRASSSRRALRPAHRGGRRPGRRSGVHRRLEVGASGMAAGQRPRPAALPPRRRRRPRSPQALRRRSASSAATCAGPRRSGRSKKEAEQQAAREALRR